MDLDYEKQDGRHRGTGFRELHHAGTEDVVALELNSQGTRVAVASADHKVRVFNIENGTDWAVVEQWRAHDAEISEIHWIDNTVADFIGTTGADNKFKLWREDILQAPNSGRRFRCVYSQSPSNHVSYAAFDFRSSMHETLLVLFSLDGHLSLLESSRPDNLSSWNEIDELYPFGEHQHALDFTYALSLHHAEGPSSQAMRAGLDMSALSLAVSAGRSVKIYRAAKTKSNEGNYLLQEVLECAIGTNINNLAWAPGVLRPCDVLALACENAVVKIIEVITVTDTTDRLQEAPIELPTKGNVATTEYGIQDMATATIVPSEISAESAGSVRTRQDSSTFRNEAMLGIEHRWSAIDTIPCGSGSVCTLVWFFDGSSFAASSDDGNIYIFKQGSHKKWLELSSHKPV